MTGMIDAAARGRKAAASDAGEARGGGGVNMDAAGSIR